MSSYWYSTDGMDQRRLSGRHLDLLDHAYERRTRIEIFDDTAFGPSVCAIANPFLGTMTAGDIHYGLYRHPPLARNSGSNSFDSLVLFDSTTVFLEEPGTCDSSGSSSALQSSGNQRNRFMCYHHHQSHMEGYDDNSMRGLVNQHRFRLLQFLSQPPPQSEIMTTATTATTVPAAAATTSTTALAARRGSSGAGGAPADEDCVCCVIS